MFDVGRFDVGVRGHQQLGLGRGGVHEIVLVRFALLRPPSVSEPGRVVFCIVVVDVLILQRRLLGVVQFHDAAETGAVEAEAAARTRRGLRGAGLAAEVLGAEVGRERSLQRGEVALLAAVAAEIATAEIAAETGAAKATGRLGKSGVSRAHQRRGGRLWKIVVTVRANFKNY